jgi:hypothetical protein
MRKVSEAADNYPRIVAMLDDGRRVIDCAASIQWIIQQRLRETRYPWEGHEGSSYSPGGAKHPALMALPDRFQAGKERF